MRPTRASITGRAPTRGPFSFRHATCSPRGMTPRQAAALRLLLAELELRHAQEALDGSEQSRQRYARARIETVEATEHARAAITIDPAAQEIR